MSPGAYMGRIGVIDLTTRSVQEEALPETLARDFLGGYGIGARMIYSRQEAGVDPLGSDSSLAFLTGPLTGTPIISGARFAVAAKSPLTHTWGDSNAGGYFGPALKFAGYDALFVTGQASEPLYLHARNGKLELRPAGFLWGMDTSETEESLKTELGREVQVACIGQAGEKQSLIACIIHDRGRAAGRSGLGAVMGAKRLKAVVVEGNARPAIAYPERLKTLRRQYLAQLKAPAGDLYRNYGTSAFVKAAILAGEAPAKNWSGVAGADFGADCIDGPEVAKYQRKPYTCFRCPIGCGGLLDVSSESHEVKGGHKPQYETLCSFGPLILNDDLESIVAINDLCNRAGIDTISAGTVIAFAMECYENGLLTEADTGGLALRWGDGGAALALLHEMIRRESIGAILADGVSEAVRHLGSASKAYAVHAAGQEPGMIDPKLYPWMAATYQLDATPGRHTQGGPWCETHSDEWKDALGLTELGRGYKTSWDAQIYKRLATMLHTVNASGICQFPWYIMSPMSIPDFLSAATGWDIDMKECFRIGERIANIRQAFNSREGFNPLDRPLHGRIIGRPPLRGGPTAGVQIDIGAMNAAYLAAMDWDTDTARPLPRKLAELGLDDVVADLW